MCFKHQRRRPPPTGTRKGGLWAPTSVADAGVAVPGVVAVAMLRAGARGAGVLHVTAILHPDLEGVLHVQRGDIGGRLPHSHTLR